MRYLKRQNINRRILQSTTVYSDAADANVYINPRLSGSMALPQGTDAQIPSSPVNGMMRYNVDHGEVQVYQSNKWRSLRFKESTQITQQNLGAGDDSTVYFGPLSSAYSPSNISSNVSSFTGQNIIVVVENVIQLSGINYTVVQNPSIGTETYTAYSSTSTSQGATTVYFNTSISAGSLEITGATNSGATITVTYASQVAAPFASGSTIIVTGFTPAAYNGTYTVTSCDTTTLVYTANGNPGGSATVIGTITANLAIYPSVNITGATVTGSVDIQSDTTVLSYTTDPYTDALTSIVLSQPTITGTIAANTAFTITASLQTGSGYYLYFNSPVPYGKTVTALIGFDQ
jgi:hypothetical protein